MSDEANIIGKGREILLPPQGNPFKKENTADEPKDLSPAEIAARFGGASVEPTASVGGTGEPSDLSPADVAALFPATADERNAIPSLEASRAQAADLDSVVPPSLSSGEVAAMLAEQSAGTPLPPRPPERAKVSYATMAAAAAARDDDAHIDITAFNPDAPIGQPRVLSSETGSAPVDISAFNPDAPAGMPAPALPEATTIDASGIRGDVSMAETSVVPSSTPGAGFKPYDPFAPGAGKPVPMVSVELGLRPAPDIVDGSEQVRSLPTVAGDQIKLPTHEDEQMIRRLVTDDRVDALWNRIDDAERKAIADDSTLPEQRAINLENLRTARNILLGGREYYEDALRYVAEVEADVLYAGRVRRWSYTYGVAVLLYNLLWLAVLGYGYAMAGNVAASFAGTVAELYGRAIWITTLAGGLGGISKALFALYTHVTHQDFDRQHMMWYIISPIFGAVLGLFVFMFVQMGLVGAFTAASIGSSAPGSSENVQQAVSAGGYIMYALAWVVGFQQNLVLKLVERVKKMVLSDEEESGKTDTEPTDDKK